MQVPNNPFSGLHGSCCWKVRGGYHSLEMKSITRALIYDCRMSSRDYIRNIQV